MEKVVVVVDWDDANANRDPAGYIGEVALQKLSLQRGYETVETEAVAEQEAFKESCRQGARRMHEAEEKRLRVGWKYPDKVKDHTQMAVPVRFERPGTRGFLNRRMGVE